MEMRDLVSKQEAQRAVAKAFKSGGGGFFGKFVDQVVDDYILNPAITTRAAQVMKNVGNAKNWRCIKTVFKHRSKTID